MNTKLLGDVGENFAVNRMIEDGYTILERNAKYSGCEVDIIAECYIDKSGNLIKQNKNRFRKILSELFDKNLLKGERTIVFCEVKTRYDDTFGAPEEAVTPYKVGRYVTAAKSYQKYHHLTNCKIRFDIFAIGEEGFSHIVNAFDERDAKYPRNY